jgi:hypothetical protein
MPDQILQVDLLVPAGQSALFEDRSAKFHNEGGFARVLGELGKPPRYEFLLALRSTTTFPYLNIVRPSGQREQGSQYERDFYRDSTLQNVTRVHRYVHMWKIKNDEDLNLAPVMRLCGDDPDYLAIDELVLEETQNFISRVRTPGGVAPFTDARRFVRTTRKLTHERVGEYVFTEPMLYPSLEVAGWRHLGQYQTFSGILNVVTEFWQTTCEDPLYAMFAAVDKPNLPQNAPANVLQYFITDVRESFVRLPYGQQGPSL